MSLLDRLFPEDIVVFPEEVVTDMDGNVRTRASTEGVATKARIQPLQQSGTSTRRQEQDNEGFESERAYTMRLPRGFPLVGAQAQVEWLGVRWVVFGTEVRYNNSPRTSHVTYTIKRY